MESSILKDFICKLIHSNGTTTIQKICYELYYHEDYVSKVFQHFSHWSAQRYMNYCRVIFVLYDYLNGTDLAVARRRQNYKENAFHRALRTYHLPPIKIIKGDVAMQESIKREHEKIQLIDLLSKAQHPLKAKALGDLMKYIQEFRDNKEFCICSKPGPQGGYYLSHHEEDIALCETWINHWRKSMSISDSFSLTA